MPPVALPPTVPASEDADVRRTLSTLRRCAPLILTSALLAGSVAALLAACQPATYQASSSLIALRDVGGSAAVRGSVYAAPPLPRGAAEQAIRTPAVLGGVLTAIGRSDLPAGDREALRGAVAGQLRGAGGPLQVTARGSGADTGVYDVQATAPTPQGARLLADAGVTALVAWDTGRARQDLAARRANLERQFGVLGDQLAAVAGATTARAQLTRQTAQEARTQVLGYLAQLTALEQSATGSLSRLSVATLPATPVSPRPLRSGLVAGLLGLLLASGAAVLFDRARRRIYGAPDLEGWGAPLLGQLPALRGAGPLAAASGEGTWRQALGFVRVNLLSQTTPPEPGGPPRRIVLTSPHRTGGQTAVTAALATALAAAGERVLVVDLETGPPEQTQAGLWGLARPLHRPAAEGPEAMTGIPVAPGVELLPAAALRRPGGALDLAALDRWLAGHAAAYDTVLFDAPALEVSPDALTLGQQVGGQRAGGLVLLAVPGLTTQEQLRGALTLAHTAQVRVLGTLLNARPVQRDRRGSAGGADLRAPGRLPGEAVAP